MNTDELTPGTAVEVRRINGEIVRGAVERRIEHLRPVGEFYLIANPAAHPGNEPPYKGRGRKSPARLAWEAAHAPIGMYERSEIRTIGGAR